jgi:multimeric flavodoxin WrbA
MKIIGICGSPRKGNTEWMLDTIMKRLAQKGAETELILLRKKSVGSCAGCLKCETGGKERPGACVQKDDMTELYPKLMSADCIVLGSPVYFEMISGQLKVFIDRTCPVWTRMGGKLLLGVAVAEEGIGQAVQNLKTYGKVCGMTWGGAVTTLAKTPSQASQDPVLKKKLLQLADRALLKI